jgi:hypothetical protein
VYIYGYDEATGSHALPSLLAFLFADTGDYKQIVAWRKPRDTVKHALGNR